jgi:hypothetical protein
MLLFRFFLPFLQVQTAETRPPSQKKLYMFISQQKLRNRPLIKSKWLEAFILCAKAAFVTGTTISVVNAALKPHAAILIVGLDA